MQRSLFVVWLGMCALAAPLRAQFATPGFDFPSFNSPYSRFGLGDLATRQNAATLGMGRMGAAWQDPLQANLTNPAAMAFLRTASFEGALFAKYASLEGPEGTDGVWNGNLAYLSLAFPLVNPLNRVLENRQTPFNWAMNVSLAPWSTVGYIVTAQSEIPPMDTVNNHFLGSGGVYALTWGNAWRYKNLAAGVHLNWLFGKIASNRQVEFLTTDSPYHDVFVDDTAYRGLIWKAGLQYRYDFREKQPDGTLAPSDASLVFGLYGQSAQPFRTDSEVRRLGVNNSLPDVDTVLNIVNQPGSGTLPASFGVGMMYQVANKLRVGAEYGIERWSQYRNDARPDERLYDTWWLSAGLEVTPDHQSYNNYFARARYRLGFFHRLDPRVENMQETGITLGAGFPVIKPRQEVSWINVALELGRTAPPEGLRETWMRLTLGFTLNDNSWFFKRKFN